MLGGTGNTVTSTTTNTREWSNYIKES
jgi:hypothetical protein